MRAREFPGSRNSTSTSKPRSQRDQRWSDDYDDETDGTDNEEYPVIDVHAPATGFDDEDSRPAGQEPIDTRPPNKQGLKPSRNTGDEDIQDSNDLASNRSSGDSTKSGATNTTNMSKDRMKQVQWLSVMHQLPSYYDEGLVEITFLVPVGGKTVSVWKSTV